MATLTEGMHTGEFIGERALGDSFHNDSVTVLSGQNLAAGAVVGSVVSGTSSSAAKAGGNTGNGTFVLDATTPILARAIEGIYRARFTSTTNIRLEDPNGVVLGDVAIVATTAQTATISEQIKALVTQGSTTFAIGDGFDVTISAFTEKVAEYNPAGTNGSEVVTGILVGAVNASAADAPGVRMSRGPATVNGNDLVWKTGLTAAQKSIARNELLRKGIRVL